MYLSRFSKSIFKMRRRNEDEVINIDNTFDTLDGVVEEPWRTLEREEAAALHHLVHALVPHGTGLGGAVQ